ncbi:ORF3 [Alphacoronavirus sp.]|uniref:ORF3 n=1 Tax=alphacoronavirus sp. WA1087 TaxID=3069910 RepID=A0AA48UFJ0_9ALPC|nr:ORF3 [Alphacoronavirus sp.]QGX41946.1 ORF3 [alphacoronavirus sp. WA1087]
MFLGLFQYTFDTVVQKAADSANLSTSATADLKQQLEPVEQVSNFTGFMLTSVFIYFFALFKCATRTSNLYFLVLRLCVLFLYVPLLYYCGAYLDASIIGCTLLVRFAIVSYYAWRYRNLSFVIFNATTLCFLNGKASQFSEKPFSVLEGGDHYIKLGNSIVPFVSNTQLYLAVRGRSEFDLQLLRSVELLDGNFLYIFSNFKIVGVTNAAFEEIQLDDYATISE